MITEFDGYGYRLSGTSGGASGNPDTSGRGMDVYGEALKHTDISWDSPFHTIGSGRTQAAAGNHTHAELQRHYSRWDMNNDKILTVNVRNYLLFDAEKLQMKNTKPSVRSTTVGTAPNQYTELTFLADGQYYTRFEVDMLNSTVGKEDLILVEGTGDGTNWIGQRMANKQLLDGFSQRLTPMDVIVEAQRGDKLVLSVRPMGSGATGWSCTWAGIVIWQ